MYIEDIKLAGIQRYRLRKSIDKWESIAFFGGADFGVNNCYLCKEFHKNGKCDGCVVKDYTGYNGCYKTPYQEWSYHQICEHVLCKKRNQSAIYTGSGSLRFGVKKDCSTCYDLAVSEYCFLIDLLDDLDNKIRKYFKIRRAYRWLNNIVKPVKTLKNAVAGVRETTGIS